MTVLNNEAQAMAFLTSFLNSELRLIHALINEAQTQDVLNGSFVSKGKELLTLSHHFHSFPPKLL